MLSSESFLQCTPDIRPILRPPCLPEGELFYQKERILSLTKDWGCQVKNTPVLSGFFCELFQGEKDQRMSKTW